jgi:hypothetical protein
MVSRASLKSMLEGDVVNGSCYHGDNKSDEVSTSTYFTLDFPALPA